jgi:hypothetical protein
MFQSAGGAMALRHLKIGAGRTDERALVHLMTM